MFEDEGDDLDMCFEALVRRSGSSIWISSLFEDKGVDLDLYFEALVRRFGSLFEALVRSS
ncbi:hypothetical protein U1Q18_015660, partial [Sarracenia purpurea var. burkii]